MRSIRWKLSGSWQVRVDAGQDIDRINKIYKRSKPSGLSAPVNFVNPVYAYIEPKSESCSQLLVIRTVTLLKLASSNIIVLQIADRGADKEAAVPAERYP